MDKNHINLCLSGQSFRIVTDAMLELEDELARAKENYEALDAKISQLRNMPRINTPAARMTSARSGQQMPNAERNLPTVPAYSSTGSTIENTAETAAESGTLVGG